MASLVILAILSSIFDRILLTSKGVDEDFYYSNQLEKNSEKFLTLFSFKRNWNLLATPIEEQFRELQFLNAVRTLLMSLVIWAHTCYFIEFLPSYNPEVNEAVSRKIKAVISETTVFHRFNDAWIW